MSKRTKLLAAIFGGWFGLHKYLDKKVGLGILYTFTFGIFGIGWIVDVFKIASSTVQPQNIASFPDASNNITSATNEVKNSSSFVFSRSSQYKQQLEELQQKYDSLQTLMTPELQNIVTLQNKASQLKEELKISENKLLDLNQEIHSKEMNVSDLEKTIENKMQTISNLNQTSDLSQIILSKETQIATLDKTISDKKREIICLDDEILVQEFGLYKPQYEFANSLEYKEKLSEIRSKQKEMIKSKSAVSGNTNWQVNGSAAQGKKMVNDTQKLLLRAFNNECDELIAKVKYTNFEASLNRIEKSAETISKLGVVMNIAINQRYLNLKIQELRLAFEYQQKKQQGKEEQRLARAEMKEAARLQKEIEEQRKKIEKEQTHYQTAYEKLLKQLKEHPDNEDLLSKKVELENQLTDINKAIKDIDYREANQKAGYVYIISNIGAFGENVYKIGMTRRLDPQDRVDELGDASVPFNFDVHAMIFSDNAPALEAALHKAFEDRKLNMVNTRREFFNVTLDEIKDVVKKNFDKTVEFIDVPDAEQFRISQKMKQL